MKSFKPGFKIRTDIAPDDRIEIRHNGKTRLVAISTLLKTWERSNRDLTIVLSDPLARVLTHMVMPPDTPTEIISAWLRIKQNLRKELNDVQ